MLTDKSSRRAVLATVCGAFLIAASSTRAEDSWPDLSKPARAIGGGEHDAAVVVGVEDYFAVPGVPGAKSNAGEWYDYLTETRGVPPQNVKLLTNSDATREEILGAARKAAGQAGANGTLWFVFVGHGAPSADGKDGLLVGVDAQQKAESLQTRSVRRGELLRALASSPAGSIRVVLDACFSGRGQDGSTIAPGLQPLLTVTAIGALDPRMAVLTAAKGNQFAGSLPGVNRPAFSYLALGGLRGWAARADGKVTAGSLWNYTQNALAATLRGRDQTPDLLGAESAVMGPSAGETGPNLARLAKATAGGSIQFNVSALPEVPKAHMPSMSSIGGLPRSQLPGEIDQAQGIDFSAVDVEALGKYDEAVKFEKGDASPQSKAAKWRALGGEVRTYADVAAKRAGQWDDYADQSAFNAALDNDKSESPPEDKAVKWKELAEKYPKYRQTGEQRFQEWARYAKELEAAAEAKENRDELRDKDWSKLSKLLSYSVVSAADKRKFALTFVSAYGKTSETNPYVAELEKYLPAGTVQVVPGAAESSKSQFTTYSAPEGDFKVSIPATWTIDSRNARDDGGAFSSYVFKDPLQPNRKLIILFQSVYRAHRSPSGRLQMFGDTSEYIANIVKSLPMTGHHYELVEATHTMTLAGRDFAVFTGKVAGQSDNADDCLAMIMDICTEGVQHYAITEVVSTRENSGRGVYSLIAISPTNPDWKMAAVEKRFVRSFQPLKTGPEGAPLDKK